MRAHWLIFIVNMRTEFKIHATRQRARAGNSTICYRNLLLADLFGYRFVDPQLL